MDRISGMAERCLAWLCYKADQSSCEKYLSLLSVSIGSTYLLRLSPQISQEKFTAIHAKLPHLFNRVFFSCQGKEQIPTWAFPLLTNTRELYFEGSWLDNRLITTSLKVLAIRRAAWNIQGLELPSLERLSLFDAQVKTDVATKVPSIDQVSLAWANVDSDDFLINLMTKAVKQLSINPLSEPAQNNLTEYFKRQQPVALSLRGYIHLPSDFYTKTLFPETLQRLDLTNTQVTSGGLNAIIASCKQLLELQVRLVEAVLSTKAHLQKLEILHIDPYLLPQTRHYNMQEMFPSLQELSIYENPSIGQEIVFMAHVIPPAGLRKLRLKNIHILSNTLCGMFRRCKELKEISFCVVEDRLSQIKLPDTIYKISLISNGNMTLSSLQTLLKQTPHITKLRIRGKIQYDNGEKWPQALTHVAFKGTDYDDTLFSSVMATKTLRELSYSGVSENFSSLAWPSSLQRCTIKTEKKPSAALLQHIFLHCQALKIVHVNACITVEDINSYQLPYTLERLVVAKSPAEVQEKVTAAVREKLPTAIIEFA